MRRLVYAPYCQAFIKGDEGVFDVSPYIVSGEVDRKVNQVSGAQLTLRNPVQGNSSRLLFTEFTLSNGSTGPLFHPMDPIIILMQRLQGHAIQVFTGYLDKSPYFQLYPGLVTIEASCTLKRLLYTQWDAALPFVQVFLQQFGWVPQGDGSIMNPTAETKHLPIKTGPKGNVILEGQFNDGSIGALLYAVLVYIAKWDPTTIWIEAIPTQIRDIVLTIYKQTSQEAQQGDHVFQSILQTILGDAGFGQGGSSSSASGNFSGGPLKSTAGLYVKGQPMNQTQLESANIILSIGASQKSTTAGVETVMVQGIAESDLTPSLSPWNPNYGGLLGGNVHHYGHLGSYGSVAVSKAETTSAFDGDGGFALPNGAKSIPNGANILQMAMTNSGSGSEYLSQAGVAAFAPEAQAIVKAAQKQSAGNSSSNHSGKSPSTAPQVGKDLTSFGSSTNSANNPSHSSSHGSVGKGISGAGKTTGASQSITNPLPKGWAQSRDDMGVDASAPVGTPYICPASCQRSYGPYSGWPNGALYGFKFNPPLAGTYKNCQYFYYAEGLTPPTKSSYKTGEIMAHSTGSSIETGWGTPGGHGTLAGADGYGGGNLPPGSGTPNGDPYGLTFRQYFGMFGLKAQGAGATGSSISGGGSGISGADAMADAFSTMINLPSVFDSAEALAFTGKRSFMADQPIFPFIEQLSQASLRNFMSMPNGNFFAFFPDYFGLFGRKYYWEIRDIEIIDARIDLTDDPLVTHIAVAGDVTQYHGTVDVFDLLLTSGIFTILDAFTTGYVQGGNPSTAENLFDPNAKHPTPKQAKADAAGNQAATIAFLQQYGARPYVEEVPAIRSPFFELFYAFQKFMLLWSKQFQTNIELTFMPELFPGGLVSFPDHSLQVYIEEVSHSFDYQQGFTTNIAISSPTTLDKNVNPNISQGMARTSVLRNAPNPPQKGH